MLLFSGHIMNQDSTTDGIQTYTSRTFKLGVKMFLDWFYQTHILVLLVLGDLGGKIGQNRRPLFFVPGKKLLLRFWSFDFDFFWRWTSERTSSGDLLGRFPFLVYFQLAVDADHRSLFAWEARLTGLLVDPREQLGHLFRVKDFESFRQLKLQFNFLAVVLFFEDLGMGLASFFAGRI